MKKSVLALAMAFGVTSAFAQDLTSKKGEPYLPEAGDWAIGIDATPFLNYAGNFFGKTAANSAPTFNFLAGNNAIVGKMFKDEKTAYRGAVRLGFGGSKTTNQVATRYADPAAAPTSYTYPSQAALVDNVRKVSNKNIALSAGMEFRRGKTRLQGYYGGEVGIGYSGTSKKYTYGNALVAPTSSTPGVTVDATDDNFGDGNIVAATGIQGQIGDARITQQKGGGTITFGLRGFIGAEYFIFPKLSLGGEFGWGLGLSRTGATKTTYEGVGMSSGATSATTGTLEIKTVKSGSWALDTDNLNSVFGPAAQIRMNFHF